VVPTLLIAVHQRVRAISKPLKKQLMDLLNSKIQEIPGVTATETLISLEQSIKKEIPIRKELED
jgi:hypothetical protein